MAKTKYKYFSLDDIKSRNCKYNIIFGERSNGKSYACKMECLNAVKKGKKFAIVRREMEDFKYKRGTQYFTDVVNDGYLEKLKIPVENDETGEKYYNTVIYQSMRYYLGYTDWDTMKTVKSQEPIGYCFALSMYEHDKSTSYPDVTTVVFEEFITRGSYYPDEFVIFANVLSTIIRQRNDVVIYMLGNTVNQYCPYFAEMGLKHIKKMEKGDIDVYTYGDTGLSVAVQYADSISKSGKESDCYFAFDNSKIKMITQGDWELEIYPHLPMKYLQKDVAFTYFVEFKEEILQCEIIRKDGEIFTYVHMKTTPIKDRKHDIVFSTYDYVYRSHNKNFLHPSSKIHRRIREISNDDNMFFQDNETGEIWRNYLLWCVDN